MQCAEDYVRFCCKFLLDNCRQDLEFVAKMIDSSAIERLEQVGAWGSPWQQDPVGWGWGCARGAGCRARCCWRVKMGGGSCTPSCRRSSLLLLLRLEMR
jgi:hypothetical protein